MTTNKHSLADQAACVEREIAMRRKVYAGLTKRGQMEPELAKHEIAVMHSVLLTIKEAQLRKIKEAEAATDKARPHG